MIISRIVFSKYLHIVSKIVFTYFMVVVYSYLSAQTSDGMEIRKMLVTDTSLRTNLSGIDSIIVQSVGSRMQKGWSGSNYVKIYADCSLFSVDRSYSFGGIEQLYLDPIYLITQEIDGARPVRSPAEIELIITGCELSFLTLCSKYPACISKIQVRDSKINSLIFSNDQDTICRFEEFTIKNSNIDSFASDKADYAYKSINSTVKIANFTSSPSTILVDGGINKSISIILNTDSISRYDIFVSNIRGINSDVDIAIRGKRGVGLLKVSRSEIRDLSVNLTPIDIIGGEIEIDEVQLSSVLRACLRIA